MSLQVKYHLGEMFSVGVRSVTSKDSWEVWLNRTNNTSTGMQFHVQYTGNILVDCIYICQYHPILQFILLV